MQLPETIYHETLGGEPKSRACQKKLDFSESLEIMEHVDLNTNLFQSSSTQDVFQFQKQDRETTNNCKMGSIKICLQLNNRRCEDF